MNKLFGAALFIAAAFVSNAQEITVEEILSNYHENIGGVEAWSKVTGQKITASASVQGMDLPIEIYEMKDGRQKTKFTLQGKEIVQDAYDGETMWAVSFMTMKAEKAESETTENHKLEIGEFPDALMTYKEMGYTVELDGEDVKDGVDCYKLKLTKKNQMVEGEEVPNIVYYFFDKENFVPIMVEQEMMAGPGKGQMMETMFSDYQEVDGLYFPFSITQGGSMGGFVVQIESIELNPEVDDAIFAFPEE